MSISNFFLCIEDKWLSISYEFRILFLTFTSLILFLLIVYIYFFNFSFFVKLFCCNYWAKRLKLIRKANKGQYEESNIDDSEKYIESTLSAIRKEPIRSNHIVLSSMSNIRSETESTNDISKLDSKPLKEKDNLIQSVKSYTKSIGFKSKIKNGEDDDRSNEFDYQTKHNPIEQAKHAKKEYDTNEPEPKEEKRVPKKIEFPTYSIKNPPLNLSPSLVNNSQSESLPTNDSYRQDNLEFKKEDRSQIGFSSF